MNWQIVLLKVDWSALTSGPPVSAIFLRAIYHSLEPSLKSMGRWWSHIQNGTDHPNHPPVYIYYQLSVDLESGPQNVKVKATCPIFYIKSTFLNMHMRLCIAWHQSPFSLYHCGPQTSLLLGQAMLFEAIAYVWNASAFSHCLPGPLCLPRAI